MTRTGRLLLLFAAAALVVGAFQFGCRLGRPDLDRLKPTPPTAAPTVSATATPFVSPMATPPTASPRT